MRGAGLIIAASGAILLAGCATLGGNVKGDFQCSAPGGTCAPTSTIDDQAISSMTSDASVKQSPASDTGGQDAINRYPVAPGSATALKVVLPAQQDREGHWRNQSVVYVEGAAPLQAAADTATAPRLSLSDLAAGAPEIAMFDTAPPVTTADIRRKVEATLAANATSSRTVPPARTAAITLPGETSGKNAPTAPAATPAALAAAKSDAAAAIVAGPGLPLPDTGDK